MTTNGVWPPPPPPPPDYPLTPLFMPKIVVALGFSLLVTTALQMMLSMIAESALPRLHLVMGGEDITQAITDERAVPEGEEIS